MKVELIVCMELTCGVVDQWDIHNWDLKMAPLVPWPWRHKIFMVTMEAIQDEAMDEGR